MKKRLISATVMFLVFLPLLIAGGRSFHIAIGVLALLACKELIDLRSSHSKIPNGVTLATMLGMLLVVFYEYQSKELSYGISYRLLILLIILFFLPTLVSYKKGEYETKDAFYLLGLILLIGIPFNSMIILRNMGISYVIYLLIITIMTDTFAFITGKMIGKHKIAPRISPKKTVEGCIGGLIMGTLTGVIYQYYFMSRENILIVFVISMLISLMAQIGDFVFSKIKRENEIKDFSNIIPGHGGILDRFDSLIFATMTYMLLLKFF